MDYAIGIGQSKKYGLFSLINGDWSMLYQSNSKRKVKDKAIEIGISSVHYIGGIRG